VCQTGLESPVSWVFQTFYYDYDGDVEDVEDFLLLKQM
jgi:hypothetical protein